MGIPVADEYYERYRRLSHAELYRQLMAGSPAQVEELATDWHRAEDALRALATSLRRDLAALAPNWTGAGSHEYQRRLGLLVRWTEELAEEAVTIRTGLTLMSNLLADAQRKAEPDPGAAPAERVDGVLGPEVGHAVAAAERQRAHDRMARLVADLAASYAVADHQNWPVVLAEAPAGLPGAVLAAVEEHRFRQHGSHRVHWRFGGTQLAGHVGHHMVAPPEPVLHQHAPSATPPVPHSSSLPPAAHLRGVSTVRSTGSGLAGASTPATHLEGSAGHLSGTEAATPTTSAPMPMMGAGAGGYAGATPVDGTVGGGYHRPFETDNSWLAGGTTPWADGVDDAPPAVLGDSA